MPHLDKVLQRCIQKHQQNKFGSKF